MQRTWTVFRVLDFVVSFDIFEFVKIEAPPQSWVILLLDPAAFDMEGQQVQLRRELFLAGQFEATSWIIVVDTHISDLEEFFDFGEFCLSCY